MTNIQKLTTKALGWDVPFGTIPCWVVSDEARINALKNRTPFQDCRPHAYFKPTKRLDNNFIQGNLQSSMESDFHRIISTGITYFENYQRRKPIFFTLDRVTLYRLVEIIPTNPLTFILKRIDEPQSIIRDKAFMIMPFGDPELNRFYLENVKSFLKNELNIDIYRADDFDGNDIIIDTIYKQIEESEFIITETSESNKNVFYEFGWAASRDKEIITIQNEKIEKQLFFDRVHIRAIFYSFDRIEEFQENLKNTIVAIQKKMDSKN